MSEIQQDGAPAGLENPDNEADFSSANAVLAFGSEVYGTGAGSSATSQVADTQAITSSYQFSSTSPNEALARLSTEFQQALVDYRQFSMRNHVTGHSTFSGLGDRGFVASTVNDARRNQPVPYTVPVQTQAERAPAALKVTAADNYQNIPTIDYRPVTPDTRLTLGLSANAAREEPAPNILDSTENRTLTGPANIVQDSHPGERTFTAGPMQQGVVNANHDSMVRQAALNETPVFRPNIATADDQRFAAGTTSSGAHMEALPALTAPKAFEPIRTGAFEAANAPVTSLAVSGAHHEAVRGSMPPNSGTSAIAGHDSVRHDTAMFGSGNVNAISHDVNVGSRGASILADNRVMPSTGMESVAHRTVTVTNEFTPGAPRFGGDTIHDSLTSRSGTHGTIHEAFATGPGNRELPNAMPSINRVEAMPVMASVDRVTHESFSRGGIDINSRQSDLVAALGTTKKDDAPQFKEFTGNSFASTLSRTGNESLIRNPDNADIRSLAHSIDRTNPMLGQLPPGLDRNAANVLAAAGGERSTVATVMHNERNPNTLALAAAAERTQLAGTTARTTYGAPKTAEQMVGVSTTSTSADHALARALSRPAAADAITRAQLEAATATQALKASNNLSTVQDRTVPAPRVAVTDKPAVVSAAAANHTLTGTDRVPGSATVTSATQHNWQTVKVATSQIDRVVSPQTNQLANMAADKHAINVNPVMAHVSLRNDRVPPVALPQQLNDRVSVLLSEKQQQSSQTLLSPANRQLILPTDRISASLPGQTGVLSGRASAVFATDAAQLVERARLTTGGQLASGDRIFGTQPAAAKAISFAPDRVVAAADRNAPSSVNVANLNNADVRAHRPGQISVGDRTSGQVGTTERGPHAINNDRVIKAVDLGGDRGAQATHLVAGRAPAGRDLGIHGIRDGAVGDKSPLQIGLAGDRALSLGNKLVALKPLHQISENDKRYLTGIELALGVVALTAVARARASEGREGTEEDEPSEGSDEELTAAQTSDDYDANVIQRPKHMVQPGETLTTIAEEYYNDARLAWLILSLNRGKLSETWKGDICYVEVNGRQELELPVGEDISTFYKISAGKYNEKRLVTSVRQSHMDQELVTLAFHNVVGRGRRLQSASS